MKTRASSTTNLATKTGNGMAVFFRLAMKLVLVAAFVFCGLFIGGFLQFTSTVTSSGPPVDLKASQGIVALTGGSTRISSALQLMSEKKGERLLISGVSVETEMSDIQSINEDHEDVFSCCVDIERAALDTVGNAVETTKWMRLRGYKSLILVTSAYHMPRSMMEFRRQMPDVKITPYPVTTDGLSDGDWWKSRKNLRFMMSEYLKYFGAWTRKYIAPQLFASLRSGVMGS